MNSAKIFIAYIFLMAFAFQISAQNGKPAIVWKNLQTNYESFYEIKPTIVNLGEKPVYFDCNINNSDAETLGIKLTKKTGNENWFWNVWKCGTISKKELKKQNKEFRRVKNLRQEGKYIPSGCKLNPNQEFTFDLSKKVWDGIIIGDGVMYEPYKSGIYRFNLYIDREDDYAIINSPEFTVNLKK